MEHSQEVQNKWGPNILFYFRDVEVTAVISRKPATAAVMKSRISFSKKEELFLAHKGCHDKYKDTETMVQKAASGQTEKHTNSEEWICTK